MVSCAHFRLGYAFGVASVRGPVGPRGCPVSRVRCHVKDKSQTLISYEQRVRYRMTYLRYFGISMKVPATQQRTSFRLLFVVVFVGFTKLWTTLVYLLVRSGEADPTAPAPMEHLI